MPQSPRVGFEIEGGLNTVSAPDQIKPGSFPYLSNVRKLLGGRLTARPPLGNNQLASAIASGITSLVRMNDPYMGGAGFVYVLGAAGKMYVDVTQVATGLSGLPLSFLPYGPPNSPQPWCYVADSAGGAPGAYGGVTLNGYGSYTGPVCGMMKVRSDGTIYKTGIMEPQNAPVVAPMSGAGANWASWRYAYRSSITGATSNPSPESPPQIVPQTSVASPIAATASTVSYNTNQYEVNGSQLRTVGSVAPGTVTDYVIATGFGFDVPAGLTVDGVQAAMNWLGQYAGTGFISGVALFYQGQIIGQAFSPGTENSQSASTVVQGGAANTWGAILTPDIVNDPSFGIGFQITTAESGGSDRSFINNFTATIYYTTLAATMTFTASTDPQADKIDVYRQDTGLDNFTYVGTIENSAASAGFTDTLPDLQVVSNPQLSFANYEPFPSIDLPRSGTCNVGTVSQQVSAISILTAGTGQTNGTYNINGVGGGGTGAIVQIVIAGGVITTATVTAGGSDYTSSPTFTVAEGGTPGTLAATISPVYPLGSNVEWVSGDTFNLRWLPGTVILISNSSGSQIAYDLYNRPQSTTELTAYTSVASNTGFTSYGFPPAGTGLAWEIQAPALAAQPSPVIWGPTPDNAGSFYFGLDPLNPGDLVWSMGNNFDSAPDTNRMYVSSPSEALQNGTVTAELSTVFSTERFWLIYPNFADAVAAATGTQGQQWTLVQSAATRGLYMRYAIGALGSLLAWRAKDGICLSVGGGPEKMLTDAISNLFPQGGQAPAAVAIGGQTVYPPDDTKPSAQTITLVPGYIFYDYQDTTATARTLVYDMDAKGWTVDTYTPLVNCHGWAVGDVFNILAACTDGTVRILDSGGTETGNAIVVTGSQNGGNQRTLKRIGGVFLRAAAAAAITAAFWANRFQVAITGASPTTLGPASGEDDYLIDFTSAANADVQDLGLVLSFPLGSTWLKEWQPDWTELPAPIAAWRTGMLAYAQQGWQHVPWLRFAYASTTQVNLTLTTDQGAAVTLAIPSSGGAVAKYFTWVPAYDAGGAPMKFRMIEWIADAGGTPFTVYAEDIEVAVKSWGSTGPYQPIKPFRAVSQIPGSTV